MSQENVEVVRAAIDALNREDWDAVFRDAAPSFEFDLSRSFGPWRGVYGIDQFRLFMVEFTGSWESMRTELDEFIEAGDLVVTHGTTYLRGRDGIEVSATGALVWTIRDGAMERLVLYQERQAALEALGLSEQDAHPDS
jgi:ketosteroid isomerase-like protein